VINAAAVRVPCVRDVLWATVYGAVTKCAGLHMQWRRHMQCVDGV
jgi:hypothetical protein